MFCKIILPSNEIHKLPAVPKTYDELHQTTLKKFKNKVPEQFYFKYKDCDDELITLSNDEDLQTAVVTSEADNVKTLRIFLISDLAPQPLNLNVSQPPLSYEGFDSSKSRHPANSVFSQEFAKRSSEPSEGLDKSGVKRPDELNASAIDLSKRYLSHPNRLEKEGEALYDKGDILAGKSAHLQAGGEQTSATSPFNKDQLSFIGDMLERKLREKVEDKVQNVANDIVFKIIEDWRNKSGRKNQYTHTPFSSRSMVSGFGMKASYRKSQMPEDEEATCAECKNKIEGVKFSCLDCPSYSCCESCEEKAEHAHPLLKIRLSKTITSAKNSAALMVPNKSQSGGIYNLDEQGHPNPNGDSSNSSPSVAAFGNQHPKHSSSWAMSHSHAGHSQDYPVRNAPRYQSGLIEQKMLVPGGMAQGTIIRRDFSGATPGGTPGEKEPKKYKASIVKQPLYDLINVKSGQEYTVEFTIKNTGDLQWPEDIKIICINGVHKEFTSDLKPLSKNEKQDVKLVLKSPIEEGRHLSQWRLRYFEDNTYKVFGSNLFVEINVTQDKKPDFVQAVDSEAQNNNKKPANKSEPPKEPAKGLPGKDEDYIDENGFNARERKIIKDTKCSDIIIKHVKALRDIYPDDDIQDQINFIEECPISLDLNEIVDIYPGRWIGKKP